MKAWPRAVLFDFDGTLADSYAAIAASVNHVRTGKGYAPLPEDVVKRFVGRGPVHLLQNTIPDVDLDRDLASYRAHHPTVMRPLTRLLPGAFDALAYLHERPVAIGVCSNKPRVFTQELLAYLRLLAFTQVIIGPEDVARPKPAPDMLLAALHRLDCLPDQALYVGDMTVDVETARAAGTPVWIVGTGSDTPEAIRAAQPDKILASLAELVTLI
jgi:phosphoglycolate phosphatase